MKEKYIRRDMEHAVEKALLNYPVVILEGARQVGKTTLVKRICRKMGGRFLTLDDFEVRDELHDSHRLLGDGSALVVVDEIQRNPELVTSIKGVVDNDRRNGMFLLTGSSDRFRMKAKYDDLQGRSANFLLRPLSQFEFAAAKADGSRRKIPKDDPLFPNFVDSVLDGRSPPDRPAGNLEEIVAEGGYPILFGAEDKSVRMERYIHQSIFRPSLDKGRLQGVHARQTLYKKLAGSIGHLRNISDIAKATRQSDYYIEQLYELLSNNYFIEELPGFGEKPRNKKVTGTPKLYLNDSGMATNMLNFGTETAAASPSWGTLLENFVLSELRKHKETSRLGPMHDFSYFRENNGIEVDFVLGKRLDFLAFEVKATIKVRRQDTRNLREFREVLGKKCKRAILFHCGEHKVDYQNGVEAWPISSLLHPW